MLLTHFQLIEKQEKYELILKSGDCVVNSNFKSQKKLPTLDINKFLNLAFVDKNLAGPQMLLEFAYLKFGKYSDFLYILDLAVLELFSQYLKLNLLDFLAILLEKKPKKKIHTNLFPKILKTDFEVYLKPKIKLKPSLEFIKLTGGNNLENDLQKLNSPENNLFLVDLQVLNLGDLRTIEHFLPDRNNLVFNLHSASDFFKAGDFPSIYLVLDTLPGFWQAIKILQEFDKQKEIYIICNSDKAEFAFLLANYFSVNIQIK